MKIFPKKYCIHFTLLFFKQCSIIFPYQNVKKAESLSWVIFVNKKCHSICFLQSLLLKHGGVLTYTVSENSCPNDNIYSLSNHILFSTSLPGLFLRHSLFIIVLHVEIYTIPFTSTQLQGYSLLPQYIH